MYACRSLSDIHTVCESLMAVIDIILLNMYCFSGSQGRTLWVAESGNSDGGFMDFQFIFFGSLLSLVLVLVAVSLFAAIVPYVPFLRLGLRLFVFGDKDVTAVLNKNKNILDQALLERDVARNSLRHLADDNFSVDYIREISERFSFADTVVKKVRRSFDRSIGVAFILGYGRDAMRFLK